MIRKSGREGNGEEKKLEREGAKAFCQRYTHAAEAISGEKRWP